MNISEHQTQLWSVGWLQSKEYDNIVVDIAAVEVTKAEHDNQNDDDIHDATDHVSDEDRGDILQERQTAAAIRHVSCKLSLFLWWLWTL